MGCIKPPEPAKLIVAMLSGAEAALDAAAARLSAVHGPVDYASPLLPFTVSSYYAAEMGPGLRRQFIAFARLIQPDDLPVIKQEAMALEDDFAVDGRRTVNLDPGYLCAGKLVLATTKNQQHRLYLGQGVYGEVALRYRAGAWQPWEWTYPDYRSPEYVSAFADIRRLFMRQREKAAGPTRQLLAGPTPPL
jgi:hypothetical protein